MGQSLSYIWGINNENKNKMKNFKNRRDAILEVATLENKSDVLNFMGRMVSTMKAHTLSTLDCEMIADELRIQLNNL